MAERLECAVIGAGVVGLAIARALALAGREVVILEAEAAIGTHTSSRNSEVIHAGIYYPRGSLKAQLCVAGKQALYPYCRAHGVEHRNCGKLIVATSEAERPELDKIRAHAAASGVHDLVPLSGAEVRSMEPSVRAVAGLFSPSTGIIDSHGLMLAYLGEAEAAGAMLALNAPVVSGRAAGGRILLEIGGDAPMALDCGLVVNAGGLFAPDVARRIEGLDPARIPPARYAKGNYFTLPGRSPFSRLVYPVPEQAGLGVHVTLDLGGQARFGPDVEWIDRIDYTVNPARADVFYAAIRRYWPELADGALQPGYAGIRPKLQGPGEPARDFVIDGPAEHGTTGYIGLYGIESPGLTASLAIADLVCAKAAAG